MVHRPASKLCKSILSELKQDTNEAIKLRYSETINKYCDVERYNDLAQSLSRLNPRYLISTYRKLKFLVRTAYFGDAGNSKCVRSLVEGARAYRGFWGRVCVLSLMVLIGFSLVKRRISVGPH